MAFHNPFIKDGQIRFPDNGNLVRHVERWAKVRGDKLAYRFLDYSTEREGVERDLNWADFGARNRAVGARLQQVTPPGRTSPSHASSSAGRRTAIARTPRSVSIRTCSRTSP